MSKKMLNRKGRRMQTPSLFSPTKKRVLRHMRPAEMVNAMQKEGWLILMTLFFQFMPMYPAQPKQMIAPTMLRMKARNPTEPPPGVYSQSTEVAKVGIWFASPSVQTSLPSESVLIAQDTDLVPSLAQVATAASISSEVQSGRTTLRGFVPSAVAHVKVVWDWPLSKTKPAASQFPMVTTPAPSMAVPSKFWIVKPVPISRSPVSSKSTVPVSPENERVYNSSVMALLVNSVAPATIKL
mmetsp:Transcript_12733/g.23272  ORF Transcript_12733/g.23272 Transcript_12733/m.23272 type:complete len:239 (-) Transcript_12733:1285-2001(-)